VEPATADPDLDHYLDLYWDANLDADQDYALDPSWFRDSHPRLAANPSPVATVEKKRTKACRKL